MRSAEITSQRIALDSKTNELTLKINEVTQKARDLTSVNEELSNKNIELENLQLDFKRFQEENKKMGESLIPDNVSSYYQLRKQGKIDPVSPLDVFLIPYYFVYYNHRMNAPI